MGSACQHLPFSGSAPLHWGSFKFDLFMVSNKKEKDLNDPYTAMEGIRRFCCEGRLLCRKHLNNPQTAV
jgi:hypothetical protein